MPQAQISLSEEHEATDELLPDAKLAAWNAYLVLRPDAFAARDESCRSGAHRYRQPAGIVIGKLLRLRVELCHVFIYGLNWL